MKPSDRIILSVDATNLTKIKEMVERLSPMVGMFRFSWPLILSEGLEVINRIYGNSVFLDLRLAEDCAVIKKMMHQIGNENLVRFLSISPFLGKTGISAVVKAANPMTDVVIATPSVVMNKEDFRAIGSTDPAVIKKTTLSIVKSAINMGVVGVLCSPDEVDYLRKELDQKVIIIADRITHLGSTEFESLPETPFVAVKSGANFLLVSDLISAHYQPTTMAKLVADHIEHAVQKTWKEKPYDTPTQKPKLKVTFLDKPPQEETTTVVPVRAITQGELAGLSEVSEAFDEYGDYRGPPGLSPHTSPD